MERDEENDHLPRMIIIAFGFLIILKQLQRAACESRASLQRVHFESHKFAGIWQCLCLLINGTTAYEFSLIDSNWTDGTRARQALAQSNILRSLSIIAALFIVVTTATTITPNTGVLSEALQKCRNLTHAHSLTTMVLSASIMSWTSGCCMDETHVAFTRFLTLILILCCFSCHGWTHYSGILGIARPFCYEIIFQLIHQKGSVA